jgi:hypothetical protein
MWLGIIANMNVAREGAFKEGLFVGYSFYLQSGFQQKRMYCKYFLGSPG